MKTLIRLHNNIGIFVNKYDKTILTALVVVCAIAFICGIICTSINILMGSNMEMP